jgi:hypothetical protein
MSWEALFPRTGVTAHGGREHHAKELRSNDRCERHCAQEVLHCPLLFD